MGGFSYRGRNIGDFGDIYYIPDESERGEYALPYDVSEQEINGRDGALYYGNRVEPREFSLRCYYEELTQRNKEDIMHWFHRDTKGRLMFDDREYAYYDVHPNGAIKFDDYKYHGCDGEAKYQGIMTIKLKAYCPFGKMIPYEVVNTVPFVGSAIVDVDHVGLAVLPGETETVILMRAKMPQIPSAGSAVSFYIYNPGTERTPLRMRIAGATTSGEDEPHYGVITNETNGTQCKIIGMTSGNTTDVNKYLQIDAETGRVEMIGLLDTSLAFQMHDYGYIWLDPCTPFVREAAITYTSGDTVITSDGKFYEDLVGQYVYLNGEWRKIGGYTNKNTMTLTAAMDASGTETSDIVTMNEITLSGFSLTKLEVDYIPRVR